MIFGELVCYLLLVSCNSKVSTSVHLTLECVLDCYTETFQMRLGDEVSIIENIGWSDTTSLIMIETLNSLRLPKGEYWYTEYRGVKIYFSQYDLEESEIIIPNEKDRFLLPSGLNWEKIRIEKDNAETGLTPPEEFDEIQMVYDYNKNCIIEPDIMGYLKFNFKDKIKTQCGLCAK